MMGRWEIDGGCKMQKFWGEGEEAGELYMGGGIAVAEKSGWPGIKSLIAVQKSFSAGRQLGGETKAGWDQARSGPSLQPRWMWEVDSRTPCAA